MESTCNCEKLAVAPVICKRRSPRAFSDRPLDTASIASILEAARWAPSAFNEQPWRFIFAAKPNTEEFKTMLACLVEANQVWAKNAYLLIILVVKKNFDFNGKENRWAYHDCGLAMENLLLQATELGIASHPMAGFSVQAVKDAYGVPDDYEPMVAVAIGYGGDPDSLPDDLRERENAPRERNPLCETAFCGKWGLPFESL